jgi:hypothetical protein
MNCDRNRFGGRDWGKKPYDPRHDKYPEQRIFNILKNQEKILDQQEKIIEQQKKIIKRLPPPPFIPPDCEYL